MTCIRRNLDTQNCCNQWQKGIRTIDGQYPDDNREFEIRAGNGILIQPITAGILITNSSAASSFIAGNNIQLTPSGTDVMIETVDGPTFDDTTTINATLQVNGDIIQNGAAYETHAEKIYTTNDYVIMRDGAISALGSGDYSGFQVKLYDGVNDGRLVIDNAGTARVGDVGDEQPLLTREESADLTDGDVFIWDAANSKAIGITNNFTQGTGNIGSDTKPIKIVNGVATAVSSNLLISDTSVSTATVNNITITYVKMDKLLQIDILNAYPSATGDFTASLPTGCTTKQGGSFILFAGTSVVGQAYWYANSSSITLRISQTLNYTDGHCLVIIN